VKRKKKKKKNKNKKKNKKKKKPTANGPMGKEETKAPMLMEMTTDQEEDKRKKQIQRIAEKKQLREMINEAYNVLSEDVLKNAAPKTHILSDTEKLAKKQQWENKYYDRVREIETLLSKRPSEFNQSFLQDLKLLIQQRSQHLYNEPIPPLDYKLALSNASIYFYPQRNIQYWCLVNESKSILPRDEEWYIYIYVNNNNTKVTIPECLSNFEKEKKRKIVKILNQNPPEFRL